MAAVAVEISGKTMHLIFLLLFEWEKNNGLTPLRLDLDLGKACC